MDSRPGHNGTEIHVPYKDKAIGKLDEENKIFVKHVRRRKHLFRKGDAWGIDAAVFTEKLLPGNLWVRIVDMDDNNRIYQTQAETIKEKGFYRHFKGHGAQIFMARKHWRKI